MICIIFEGGSMVTGSTATDALNKLCGWFNPETIKDLRTRFMKRAGCDHRYSFVHLNDDEFVRRMAEADIGFWTVKEVSKSDLPQFASNFK